MSTDDRDDLDIRTTSAWDAQEAPAGFADRVLAARAAEAPRDDDSVPTAANDNATHPWGDVLLPMLTGAVAAAAVVLLFLGVGQTDAGSLQASDGRQAARIGERATVVAEAGADLSWSTASGATVVEQTLGDVFYRVDPDSGFGASFSVRTPAGIVSVTGTCFRVEVNPMMTNISAALLPKRDTLIGAAGGAVLTAAVLVTVFEGEVFLSQGDQKVVAIAGEQALSSSHSAPTKAAYAAQPERDSQNLRQERDALRAQVEEMDQQLMVLMKAKANGEDPLTAQNLALRDEVAKLKRELDVFEQIREQREGESVDFPPELADEYREDALLKNFVAALRNAGVPGDVTSVDCSEFPCVVYGEITVDGSKEDSARVNSEFEKALYGFYAKDGHHYSNSFWTKGAVNDDGVKRQSTFFGVSVTPEDIVDEDTEKRAHKRLRFRNQQYMESLAR